MTPKPDAKARPRLSVVMIAKNEAWRLKASLEAASFAGEILVADTASIDETVKVAKAAGARVVEIPFEGYGATKQKALEASRGDWVLFLDADEVITPELRTAIEEVIKADGPLDGYAVQRRAWFLGKAMAHGGWGRDWVMRLARRSKVHVTDASLHERVVVNGETGQLPGLIEHYTDPSFPRYLAKIDRYSTIAAEELVASGKSVGFGSALLHGVSRFFKQYLMKRGYKDGVHGALLALTSGYAVALRHLKARLIKQGFEGAVKGDE